MVAIGAMLQTATGGPEVLEWGEINLNPPGAGEVRLRHTAIGVNFHDVYHRSGLYPIESFPVVPGIEGAGVVTEIGPGVSTLRPGDRVGYGSPPMGAYALQRNFPADRLARIPDSVPDEVAGCSMIRGMTAYILLHRVVQIEAGTTVLIHAAAGGAGQILCQWAHHLGAEVIGTAGSLEKVEIARQCGCDHAIVYSEENFVERVREITAGRGVQVVYDSVGADTFMGSLDCLGPLGVLVCFGQSSGMPPAITIRDLQVRGSLTLTRPMLPDYTRDHADYADAAHAWFKALETGVVKVEVAHRYPLREAGRAHADLEGRRTRGPVVMLPEG